MFKCSVKIDENLQSEINKKASNVCLVLTIIGSVGLIMYIILGTIFDSKWLYVLLWVMAILFGFGLTYMISIKKVNKKAASNGWINEIEIYEECANITSIKNNETMSTMKLYYRDVLKTRETENYFIIYINKLSAITIPKKSFTHEELSTIKLWIETARMKKD